MSSIPRQLATFAAVLAGLYAAGFAAGQIIDPEPQHGAAAAEGHTETMNNDTKTHGSDAHGAAAPDPVRGLAVAENSLQLELDDAELVRGRSAPLRFRVVDSRGRAVRDFDIAHEKRMHLIVARRDLTGFQHLHPTMAEDGTWSTPLRVEEAGSYRVFADFVRGGQATTLANDLRVDGAANLRALPAPRPTAVSDGGYDVRLDSKPARPGQEAKLAFTITKDGAPVKTEPYLGAGGHLVALRDGDLAFLHVHPTEAGHDDTHAGDDADAVSFAATFPTTGRYRLFLQFQHEGRVQTVAFTQEVR